MILLTLASLAIVLLAVSIYNKLKTDNISLINIILNKDNEHTHIREGFKEGNLSETAEKEHAMLEKRSSYYDIRDDGAYSGALTTAPGINTWIKEENLKDSKTKEIIRGGSDQPLKKLNEYVPPVSNDPTKIDNKVADCSTLESCDDLNGAVCGYCLTTNTFGFGDKKGPKTDACPNAAGGLKAWAMDAATCKKQKARATCAAVKDCGSLMGDAAQICGYCPTSGKIMAKKKVGNKWLPRFSEDKCSGSWGLLNADKCLSFAKDNPCVTPTYDTGPHNKECIQKLWKNAKCTKQPPLKKDYGWWTQQMNHYKTIGEKFLDIFQKTLSNDYEDAKHNNILCYGNTGKLKACDQKYMKTTNMGNMQLKHSPKECYEQKYQAAGCTEKGNGWKDIQNNLHLQVLSRQRKTSLYKPLGMGKNIEAAYKKLSEDSTSSNDYATKKAAAMECYGEIPPAPPAVKVGDMVGFYANLSNSDVGDFSFLQAKCEFNGIITKDVDRNYCHVMWISIMNRSSKQKLERKKYVNDMEIQKRFFGFSGVAPAFFSKVVSSNVSKSRLKMRKTCIKTKSACKPSCGDIVNNVLWKYPKPRDCIVSQYGGYSRCTKSCGGGRQTKYRKVLYQPRRGGTACPSLSTTRVCNTQPCINPNFNNHKSNKGVKGRYVRIYGYNTYIHIQELEIFDQNNRNIAKGIRYPRVRQSSQGWSGHPNYITNGQKAWRRWPNSNHTHRRGYQWIQVDLGSEKLISKIRVYNRPDCCRGRLNGCKLIIYGNGGTQDTKIQPITLNSGRVQTFDIGYNHPVPTRYRVPRNYTWMDRYNWAKRRNGRLPTVEEIQKNKSAVVLNNGHQWVACGDINNRDWVSIGTRGHHYGKSHVQRYGYPGWGNRRYWSSYRYYQVLVAQSGNRVQFSGDARDSSAIKSTAQCKAYADAHPNKRWRSSGSWSQDPTNCITRGGNSSGGWVWFNKRGTNHKCGYRGYNCVKKVGK
jgi:hypothetical protein